jgi:hypothetical protein
VGATLGDKVFQERVVAAGFGDYAKTQFEPNYYRLRTASEDSTGYVAGAEPLPRDYQAYRAEHGYDVAPEDLPKSISDYEGMNKSLSIALEGQYYGMLRLYARAAGVPLDTLTYTVRHELREGITNPGLAKRLGVPVSGTKKQTTRESLAAHYIAASDEDAPYVRRELKRYGVIVEDAPVQREGQSYDSFAKEQRKYERYQELEKGRTLAHMTPDELDARITEAGGEIPEPLLPADDLDKLPTPDDWRAFGDEAAASATEQMMALDPAIRSAVVKQVADWAESNAERIAVGTANEKLYLGLEYTAEVRKAAVKNGGDIAPPVAPPATVDSSLDDMVRAIALEPDEAITAPLRDELFEMEFLSDSAPPADLAKTDPSNFAGRNIAYQNYDRLKQIRTALHGAEELPESTVGKKTFKEVIGEDKRPANLSATNADQYLEDAVQSGDMDEEVAKGLAKWIDVPERKNEAGAVVAKAKRVRVIDVVLEQMVKHDDVLTAHRAAGSEIADALRKVKKDATDILSEAQGLKMPEVNKLLRANRYYLNLIREGYLLSPARIVSAGSLDAMGNAWFQILSGHGSTSARTLNPLAWLAFAKHTMRGDALRHPLFDIAGKTGMKVDSSIVNVVTRDLFDPGADTTWANLLRDKFRLGKVGDKASSAIAPRWGKAMRHGIDQNARAGVAWDTAMKQLPDARNDFLISIRQTQGDAVANDLATKLDRSGQFSPADVLKLTDDKGLAKQWRETLTGVSKKMTDEVNRVHFQFKMTRADEIARNVMLFHFWQSRALVFYPRTILSNPYLLNAHVKGWESLEAEADRQGLDGPMSVFVSLMKGDGGLYGYIDPVAWFIPYTMFRDAQVSYGGQTSFDKWTKLLFLNPIISTLATGVGISKEFAPVLPTSSIQNLVKAVIDYDRNHGDWLGKGPGITTDLAAYYQRKAVDALNNLLTQEGGAHDIEMPPLGTSDKRQVKALIVEQMEQETGRSYDPDAPNPMTSEERLEVARALNAIDFGTAEDNQRAQEALKQWSEGQLVEAGMRSVIPGQSYVRSEYADENQNLRDAAFDKPAELRTADEQNAIETYDVMNSGEPEATTLEVERDNLNALGTESQQALYEGWNSIAYDTLPGYAVETIGGETWYGYQVNDLSQEDRMALADAWALENGPAGADTDPGDGIEPKGELEQYRDERDEYIAGSDELGGYYEYRDRAEEFEGGVAGWREYAAGESDEFAQAMEQQRTMFEERGYVPSVIERRLDQWATSTDGYNAARGVRNRMSDPDPLDAPTELPLSNSETQAMITEAVEAGGGGSGGGYDQERGMPQWQSELVDEWQGYRAILDAFEAEYGPVSNFQSDQGQTSVARYITENGGVEPSSNLTEYLNWSMEEVAAGRDGTMEAFLALKNKEYEDRQAAKSGA